MGILKFIDNHNGMVLAAFSFIVTVATCLYVYLTFRLFKETRKIREPDLYFIIQENDLMPELLEIVIQNTGLDAAYDVRVSCEPDFRINNALMFSDLSFIKTGFRYIGPNQKIRAATVYINPEGKEEAVGPIRFTLRYSDKHKNNRNGEFIINLTEYATLQVIRRSWKHDIEKHLKKISDNVPNISSATHKVADQLGDLSRELRSILSRTR